MVDEIGKAIIRRHADSRFSTRYFVGNGIDFSTKDTYLTNFFEVFPLAKALRVWRNDDGDPMLASSIGDDTYDFVHSINYLQCLTDPEVAVSNWIRICKTNGHLVIVVADEDRYEQGVFPSTFQSNHKWTFTINKASGWSSKSISILALLKRFERCVEIIKIELLDNHFFYGKERKDQTMHGLAESGIEIVLRKVRSPNNDMTSVPSRPRRVLIRRMGAMGDVIMVTPIVDRLREELGSGAEIDVVTRRPDVFDNNPHVRCVNAANLRYFDYDKVIDLDGAYERNRAVHAIDAYMLVAFGNTNWPTKQPYIYQKAPAGNLNIDWKKAITLHAGGTQERNRRMPRMFWDRLIELLLVAGLSPVIIGGPRDEKWPNTTGVVDLTGKHNINETAWVIAQSACFVSCDTGVMHVASSTMVPIVTIYTAVLPEHRMSWRHGEFGWKTTALVPPLDCIGCNAGSGCRRSDFACVEGPEAVTPQAVFRAVMDSLPT